MFSGKRGEEGFGDQGKRVKFVAADGQSQHGDINGAGAKAFEKDRRNFFDDDHRGIGESFGEDRKNRGKKIWRNGRNDPDSDLAGDGILALDDVATSRFEFAKNGTCARKKGLANFGEPDGTAEAVE
jgi:hypothetical protein